MESELETRVSMPVVFVNRHDLYLTLAMLGVAIVSCACVLAYSIRHIGMLKPNAEEVRGYTASRINSSDQLGGSHPSANHLNRSYTGMNTIKAPFLDIRRG
ncbi:hypothetical protein MRX96_016979 [Rhipicephalus microplus]